MSVVRTIQLHCNTDDCTSIYYGPPDAWVDGPVRSAAGHEGWKYVGGKDICADCVAAILALNTCPIPKAG